MSSRRGRGEGSIEQLPSGKWRAVLSAGRRADGKRDKRQETFDTKRESLAWLRDRHAEYARGRLPDAGGATVAEWMVKWLEHKKPRVEPTTWAPYEQHCRLHLTPRLGHVRLDALRPADVADLYSAMAKDGVSPALQRKVGGTLRSALKDAMRMNMVTANVATAVARPKADAPDMETWSPDEVKRFLAAVVGDRLEALYVVALDTGMRQGELFALQWDAVDLDAGTLRVTHSLQQTATGLRRKACKTKSSRRKIALSPTATHALRLHRERMATEGRDVKDGPVFTAQKGGWLWKSSFQAGQFRVAIRRADVRMIGFHGLRHTNASLTLAAGGSLRAVSARLGHQSPAFTLSVYAHCLPEHDQKIAGIWDVLLSSVCDSPTSVPRSA